MQIKVHPKQCGRLPGRLSAESPSLQDIKVGCTKTKMFRTEAGASKTAAGLWAQKHGEGSTRSTADALTAARAEVCARQLAT